MSRPYWKGRDDFEFGVNDPPRCDRDSESYYECRRAVRDYEDGQRAAEYDAEEQRMARRRREEERLEQQRLEAERWAWEEEQEQLRQMAEDHYHQLEEDQAEEQHEL